jgi:parallel beta-helix repeat protein
MLRIVVAFAVALAFILPSAAAFANFGRVGVTSNSKNAVGINNNIGETIMSDTPREDTILIEKTVVSAVLLARGTVYVDDDRPPEWYNATQVHTITQGVTNATAGGTVYVYNGTYYDHVTVSKQLSLIGESRNNVIVDGNGTGNIFYVTVNGVIIDTFTITRGAYGISTTSSSNKIANCTVYNTTEYGIYLKSSTSSQVTNCDVHNNIQWGLYILTSTTNKLRNNTMHDNLYNFAVDTSGLTPPVSHFIQDIDTSNTVSGKPIYYLVGQSNRELNETHNMGYVGLVSCTNITAKNADVNGVVVAGTIRSRISNISSHNSKNGIAITISSNDNIIDDCDAYNNLGHGIYIWKSIRNNVTNCNAYNNVLNGGFFNSANSVNNNFRYCNAYNNKYGFYMQGVVTYNNITNCNVYDNLNTGIFFTGSSRNNIANCTSYNNQGVGIYFSSSGYNTVTDCSVYNSKYSGISIQAASGIYNKIKNCDIHDNGKFNYSGNEHGINIWSGASNNEVINCDIYNQSFGIVLDGISSAPVSNNKIISCDVHNNGHGISLAGSSNSNLTNCNVYDNVQRTRYSGYGITLDSSSDNNIINNCNEYDNTHGISLSSSSNNKLRDVTATDFYIGGTTTAHFTQDIDPSNTIKGKPIYYLIGQSNLELNEANNIGYVGLISCTNITVKNADVNSILMVGTTGSTISNVSSHGTVDGIFVFSSSNNTFINCSVYDNSNVGIGLASSSDNEIINCDTYNTSNYGIYLWTGSSRNNFTDCVVNTAYTGIDLRTSSNNNIFTNCDISNIPGYWAVSIASSKNKFTGCNVHDNIWSGFLISGAQNNDITDCNVYNNSRGIYILSTTQTNNVTHCNIYNNTIYGVRLYGSSKTKITNCNVYNNAQYGIYLESGSNNNLVHHNNFVNNVVNAYDPYSNQWDDNISGGNYWDNYTGVDADNDGIGDTPYNISGGSNKDRYPLMNPWDVIPPVITAVQAIPAVQSYTIGLVNITCTVTDNWGLVDTVKVHIDGPGGFTLEAVMNEGSYYYTDNYTTMGIYFYYIRANDTSKNIAVSDIYSFVITDLNTPTSAVNSLPLWKKIIPFTVTATAYDNTGVANVTLWSRYSSNGTAWTNWTFYGIDEDAPWSWSFTGADGYYQFYSIAIDDYENVEDSPDAADASTGIDTTKPVTTSILNGTIGENGWYVSNPVMVTLSATDALSGIESKWYKVDAGYWTLYSTPFTVSGNGAHTVQYYSFDHAGNQEIATSLTINIDTIAPTTTHTLDGLIGSQGWYVTNVTVTLSANDAVTLRANDATSGVNYTKYKLNTGDWIVYTGSFVVTTDGNYTLYYCSVDLAGNTEAAKQVVFRIQHDVVPPVTTHEFDGVMGDNNWFVGTVTVMLSAVDNSAGVASTKYKLDAGAWKVYTGAFLITEDAEHTLYYYSVDKVGNREENKSVTLKIDQTLPIIDLTVNKTGLMKWLLTANVSDATSGIAKVEFYLDGDYLGEATEAPYEWECTQKGTAQAIVFDNAGNNAISDEVPVSQSVPESQSQSSSSTLVSISKDTIQGQSIYSPLQRLFNLR